MACKWITKGLKGSFNGAKWSKHRASVVLLETSIFLVFKAHHVGGDAQGTPGVPQDTPQEELQASEDIIILGIIRFSQNANQQSILEGLCARML